MTKYDQLEKLQELKEKGVLTEIEFEVEKQKILNQPNYSLSPSTSLKPTIPIKKSNGAGIAGFIIALIGGFNWYLTLPFGILGLILSVTGMSKPKDKYNRGLAIAGLILSILIILIGIVFYFRMFFTQDQKDAQPLTRGWSE